MILRCSSRGIPSLSCILSLLSMSRNFSVHFQCFRYRPFYFTIPTLSLFYCTFQLHELIALTCTCTFQLHELIALTCTSRSRVIRSAKSFSASAKSAGPSGVGALHIFFTTSSLEVMSLMRLDVDSMSACLDVFRLFVLDPFTWLCVERII